MHLRQKVGAGPSPSPTTEPFVGAYILEDEFYHQLKFMTHAELEAEDGVHFTPMPELHKWIETSQEMAVAPSGRATRRRSSRNRSQ
jgi:hypothetical protein